MIEIEFIGTGGHGSVVAAKLLSDAAVKAGYNSQSFSSYGALRRGGKVESYVRLAEGAITPDEFERLRRAVEPLESDGNR